MGFAGRIAFALLGIAAAAPASAEDQHQFRETVVVTATAAPVPFDNLSRAVTVLTREQIARLPARSVAELLRFATSLDVRSRGAFGMQTDFAIRGATFGQALVLVDGVRINDAQSGHHNADLPVSLDDIERIEILYGAGSSVHGADAFGGTINVITRRSSGRTASVAAGAFGLVQGGVRLAGGSGGRSGTLSLQAARSSGFTFARDFNDVVIGSSAAFGKAARVQVGHVRKEFGANGFYGPSPSREWTNQTLAIGDWTLLDRGGWRATAVTSYRTHGDHFLWDVRRPGFSENRHRTHATLTTVKVHRDLGGRNQLVVGGEAGADWITSSNLGDHHFARGAVFAEVHRSIGSRTVLYPGVRFDTYSSFGRAWSPSFSASVWVAPTLRWRGAIGRAFRVPTFTELYYRDPAHEAGGELRPEHAWSGESGADWLPGQAWMVSGTVFARRERDVIDWVRESSDEKWRSTNLLRVRTVGVELEVRRVIGGTGSVGLQYARLSADADRIPLLSKYVLEYARHSIAVLASADLPWRLGLGHRLAFTERADGRNYWVADLRVSRRLGPTSIFLEGANLLNTAYQEILGVDMPSRWLRAGLQIADW